MEKLEFPRIFVKTPTILNQPIPKLSLKRKNGDNYQVQRIESSDDSEDDLPLISMLLPSIKKEPDPSWVTCGNCNKKVASELWPHHLEIHYGVAWRLEITDDPPIDLSDCQLVINKMEHYKAANNLKLFVCPQCLVQKSTPILFLVHTEQCGLSHDILISRKVMCPQCIAPFLPYALHKHLTNGNCKGQVRPLGIDRASILANMMAYIEEIMDSPNLSAPGSTHYCGKCNCVVSVSDWPAHFSMHNGIAWRLGHDPPINLRDRTAKIMIVSCFREANQMSAMHCEHCHAKRKIPKDYVLHLEECETRLASMSMGIVQNYYPSPERSADERDETLLEPFASFDDAVTIKSEVVEEDYSFNEQTEVAAPQVTHEMNTCGNCQKQIPKKDWRAHCKFHNGLAWIEGVQTPIKLTNRSEVVSVVNLFMKKYGIETLQCDKCNIVRKSAAGLFGHSIKCGSTQPIVRRLADNKIRCQGCHKMFTAIQVQQHKAECLAFKRLKTKAVEVKLTAWTEELVNRAIYVREATASMECVHIWRSEIRTTGKAACQHRQYCSFLGSSLLEMTNHIPACPVHRRNLNSCKLCTFRSESYAATYLHVTEKHSTDELTLQKGQSFDTFLYDEAAVEPIPTRPSSQEDSSQDLEWIKSMILIESTEVISKEMKVVWQTQKKANDGLFNCFNRPDCSFQTEKLKQMMGHQRKCSVPTRKLYFCKCCNYHSIVYEDIVGHIDKHKTGQSTKQGGVMVQQSGKELELQKKLLAPLAQLWRHDGNFRETSKTWMLEFCANNYATKALFPNYKCEDNMIRFLTKAELCAVKPAITVSMRFGQALHEKYSLYSSSFDVADWKRLELMESTVSQGCAVLFCGGPIVSLAWATFPLTYRGPEVLAVCCKNNPDEFYQLPDLKTPRQCLIQLWMFENMNNSAEVTKAALKYAIACDNGPMRDMKFCPSGGYDNVANRLGLLAAATVSGVSIYALPLHLDVKDSRCQIISLKPVQVLNMDGCPATCIDWAHSQSRIAAGFGNGVMAVWNLDVQTTLLRFEENGVQGLNPVKWAKATQSAITSVKFHLSGDTCYLLVTALDRRVKVYDLDTSYMPMEISAYQAKSRILSADWSPHWSAFCFGLDECLMLDRCGLYLKHPHDIGERTEILMTTESSSFAMDFNKWTNECISVSEAGDICAIKSMQLLTNVVSKHIWDSRLVFGYTDVVHLGERQVANHLNEDFKYNDDNGIVFCDLDLANNHSMASLGMKTLRSRTVIGFPFSQINRVRFNENQQAHKFYALGYQAGFVRIKKLPTGKSEA